MATRRQNFMPEGSLGKGKKVGGLAAATSAELSLKASWAAGFALALALLCVIEVPKADDWNRPTVPRPRRRRTTGPGVEPAAAPRRTIAFAPSAERCANGRQAGASVRAPGDKTHDGAAAIEARPPDAVAHWIWAGGLCVPRIMCTSCMLHVHILHSCVSWPSRRSRRSRHVP